MRIPIEMLDGETLRNVIENFITREGTDYGAQEISLAAKIDQVMRQLKSGRAVLVFDSASESCNIITSDQQNNHQFSDQEPIAEVVDDPPADWER